MLLKFEEYVDARDDWLYIPALSVTLPTTQVKSLSREYVPYDVKELQVKATFWQRWTKQTQNT